MAETIRNNAQHKSQFKTIFNTHVKLCLFIHFSLGMPRSLEVFSHGAKETGLEHFSLLGLS